MKKNAIKLFVLIIAAASIIGCKTTHTSRSVDAAGFLSDYTSLQAGSGDDPQLIYINETANWAGYKKVLMDQISVYTPRDSKLARMSADDRQALVDYADVAMRTALVKGGYTLVREPGPDVMRLRLAFTDAKASNVVLDTTSNIMPPMIAASTLKRVATGSHLAVGMARVEAEMLDSNTNRQIAAMAGERVGGMTFVGKFGKWNDTQAAVDHWAETFMGRLEKLRSK